MTRSRVLVALLLAAALPAACGGGEKPAGEGGASASAKPEEGKPAAASPGGGGGLDLESLQKKMDAARGGEEAPPAPETKNEPAGPAPSAPEPAAPAGEPEPAAKEEPAAGTPPAGPAEKVPESPSEISDEEVLASWSADEREALGEMSEEERKELIDDKRIAIFQSRGGVMPEEEAATGPRGPARPEAIRPEDLPPPALRDILEALQSPDPEIQAGAAEAAKRFEDKAVAARHIQKLLKSSNWELRSIAADTLGALGQEASIPALLAALQGETKEVVRGNAIASLKTIGGKAGIEALRTIVREGWEPADRAAALSMLTETGEVKHVLDLLPGALKDLTPEVRQRAVIAVRTYDLKDYGSNLLPLLEDFSDQVIIEALRTLGALGYRPAVGALVKILVNPGEDSDNPDSIQDAAAESLKTITGENMGYSDTLPDEQRLAAIDNWRVWWEKNRDSWK